jgi:hypothetical protein
MKSNTPQYKDGVFNTDYYRKNREKILARHQTPEYRARHKDVCLRNNYGITLEQWNEIFDRQNGCCAICGKHNSQLKKSLHVDHCHETNKVRGLLCSKCNRAIGNFNDDINLLQKAINYLHEN